MHQNAATPIPQPQSPSLAHPSLYRMNSEPPPATPSVVSPYQKLKEMDELLDSVHGTLSGARQLYQKTLQEFAILCHDLWQQEKAQGNHDGKGFRKSLQDAGIKVGRAYRAMNKFYPADFPVRRKPLKRRQIPASSAADKVLGLRFASKPLPPQNNKADGTNEAREILECTFAFTPEQKAELIESLKLVDPSRVQQLFLQAVKQAAALAGMNSKQSEIPNRDAVCSGSTHVGAAAVAAEPNHQKSEVKNRKCGEPSARPSFLELTSSEGFTRLSRLYKRLAVKDRYPKLLTLVLSHTPENLRAKLDWADGHPEWCANLRGKQAADFLTAFNELTIPCEGHDDAEG